MKEREKVVNPSGQMSHIDTEVVGPLSLHSDWGKKEVVGYGLHLRIWIDF